MGVIIKYQLNFPEVGLKISNDIFSGEFILDANITVEMKRNIGGASFKIELFDLPKKKTDEIKAKLTSLPKVIIKLGYFDSPFEKVMEGIIKDIKSDVQAEKLVTTITGQETGTFALENNSVEITLADNIKITDAVNQILSNKQISKGAIGHEGKFQNISDQIKLRHGAIRRETAMKILDRFAGLAQAEFMVSDQKVWMGIPIKDDDYKPPKFDRDVNLAVFSPIEKKVKAESRPNGSKPLPETRIEGFNFTVLGDPKLRPGQKVEAAVDEVEKGEFRIHSVTHKFTMAGGYVCEGSGMKVIADDNSRRREVSFGTPSASTVAGSVSQIAENGQLNRPAQEIGKVKAYTPGDSTEAEKHLGTLYFGQTFERYETQPSINIAVEDNEQQIFRNKPLVSPFAWHKCGLMVPVYEGMKAMLNHNLGLQDDVLINGFIWSETPVIEPPKNKAGDWWLCLPIDFDTANPPSDSTKAVNDLTANNGRRVIQLKGLKITIGNSTLTNVGERPEEGQDDEFLIEHSSGTILKIASDGKMSIEASSLSIKGDVTIGGNVEIK